MSFFHACNLVTPIDAEIRARDLPRILGVLRPVFAPCKLSYSLGDGELVRLSAGSSGELWTGEERDSERLTRFTPGAEASIIADFESAVAGRDDTTLWMSSVGPLLHRAPGDPAPRWYGHWQMDVGLHELVQLRLTAIAGQLHELELGFPLVGYPLTASRLEGDQIVDGDATAAKANRDLIIPLIAKLRAAVGLPPGSWAVEGEFGFDYPDDEVEIKRALTSA